MRYKDKEESPINTHANESRLNKLYYPIPVYEYYLNPKVMITSAMTENEAYNTRCKEIRLASLISLQWML